MSILANFATHLEEDLPVLFAYIGWAEYYNGTEAVSGNFAWIHDHPRDNAESAAFSRNDDGYFHCGVGRGDLGVDKLHVVFIARERPDDDRKVVGLYAAAEPWPGDGNWMNVKAPFAHRFAIDERQQVPYWPGTQGIRRWAFRSGKKDHPELHQFFRQLIDLVRAPSSGTTPTDEPQYDAQLEAVEGQARWRLVLHRKRESALRKQKIASGMQAGAGRLVCEVPGCGFDFFESYGQLGHGYAEVHHIKPLANLSATGQKTTLADLAIVCANCHAMIHRGGGARALHEVISAKDESRIV